MGLACSSSLNHLCKRKTSDSDSNLPESIQFMDRDPGRRPTLAWKSKMACGTLLISNAALLKSSDHVAVRIYQIRDGSSMDLNRAFSPFWFCGLEPSPPLFFGLGSGWGVPLALRISFHSFA